MTERVTQKQLKAAGGISRVRQKPPAFGRKQAQVAFSGQNGAQPRETQPAALKSKKRFVVGIDPGVKTGIAIWDRDHKEFRQISTWDFWDTVFALTRSTIYTPDSCLIVIEVAHYAPTYSHLKAEGQNKNTLSKIARNVGQVTREAQLLAEGLLRFGYEVQEVRPQGKAKKAADDVRQFQRLTGWMERTNQHERDAARLCWQR